MGSEQAFEVAVAGGGVVGAAAARALAGLRVALVCRENPPDFTTQGFDARVYALSPGSVAFLDRLGAWSAIEEVRKTPVHAMRVYGDDGASLIEFDAYRSGVGELAWIVEDRLLQQALWRGLKDQDGLTLYANSDLRDLQIGERQAELGLADGRALAAQLVVGADGARSLVRVQASIACGERPYGHTAVVANFASGKPHRNVAWQWFQGGSREGAVLALLPLPGDHVSMVWSVSSAEAARLMALDTEALAREVGAASHHVL